MLFDKVEPDPIQAGLPNHNQVELFTTDGVRFISQEGSLVKNLCNLSVKVHGHGPIIVRVPFTKADAEEFLNVYPNGRNTSETQIEVYADRMETDWAIDYDTLEIDWEGLPIDGGHVAKALIRSKLKSLVLCVKIGVDPKMRGRIDTNKVRNDVDKMGYITGLEEVKDFSSQDAQNFVTTVGYMFSFLVGYKVWKKGWQEGRAKTLWTYDPSGIALAKKLLPWYKEIREVINSSLEKAAGEPGREKFLEGLKKAQVYVVFMLLYATEQPEHRTWVRRLITGKIAEDDEALAGARDALHGIVGKSTANGRRDTEEVKHSIVTMLSYLFAKDTGAEDRFRVPPRWGTLAQYRKLCEKNGIKPDPNVLDSDSPEVKLWSSNSKKEIKAYNSFRKTATLHFIKGMKA